MRDADSTKGPRTKRRASEAYHDRASDDRALTDEALSKHKKKGRTRRPFFVESTSPRVLMGPIVPAAYAASSITRAHAADTGASVE